MISIIIPVYNQAKKLDKCLKSIQYQTYKKYEIIVVNDGSTDNVDDVIAKYKKVFNYDLEYITQENEGAPSARNRGFRKSRGEYVIFCDSDVIMYAKMIELMHHRLIKHPEASYIYSSHKFGGKTFRGIQFDENKLKEMPYIHSTSLIRREHFPESGWDESLKRLQDWDLWLTMLEQGHKGRLIDKVLFKVIPGGTMSQWTPSFVYKLFPFLPRVIKYNAAVDIIKNKHNL